LKLLVLVEEVEMAQVVRVVVVANTAVLIILVSLRREQQPLIMSLVLVVAKLLQVPIQHSIPIPLLPLEVMEVAEVVAPGVLVVPELMEIIMVVQAELLPAMPVLVAAALVAQMVWVLLVAVQLALILVEAVVVEPMVVAQVPIQMPTQLMAV